MFYLLVVIIILHTITKRFNGQFYTGFYSNGGFEKCGRRCAGCLGLGWEPNAPNNHGNQKWKECALFFSPSCRCCFFYVALLAQSRLARAHLHALVCLTVLAGAWMKHILAYCFKFICHLLLMNCHWLKIILILLYTYFICELLLRCLRFYCDRNQIEQSVDIKLKVVVYHLIHAFNLLSLNGKWMVFWGNWCKLGWDD